MAEFEIPLLSDSAIGTLYSRSDIRELAEECQRDFDCDGPEAVVRHYPLLHSFLRRFDELDKCVREQYWALILHAIDSLCQHVGGLEMKQLPTDQKRQLRNITKMLCYVAVRMVELYEREPSPIKRQSTARKKKAPQSTIESGGVPVGGKEKLTSLMSQLLELELVQLWEPPTVQVMENWSGLVGQLCYKLLENSSISRDHSVRDRVIHLLGVLVRDYGQVLSVSLKVVQLLQHFDHLVSPLAQALTSFSIQFNCKNVTMEVVREIGGKDPRDLAIDSSGTRSYAAFLVELAHLIPDSVLHCVSVLLPHLNGESYTFRNGVLGVIGELLLHLHKTPLDDQGRQLRDQLFSKLGEHIHDSNAFVRVKVLQLLMQLITSQAVPLPRVHVGVALVAGRLRDKSSSVRKNALQLLSAWLTHNPFSGKLNKVEFEEKLAEEQSRLSQLVGEGAVEEEQGSTALKQAAVVNYFMDALRFINSLQDCVPIAAQLLGSKVASDVLEALEFLCVAEQFKLNQASGGLRRALVLVWSKDENIRKALISTYVKIYFTLEPKVGKAQRTTVMVQNLLLLIDQSSARELTSLHELVRVLVEAGHIPPAVLKVLMELCTGSDVDKARLAAQILVMVSSARPSIVSSNLDVLVNTGLTQAQHSPDLVLAKYVCQAIQSLSRQEAAKGKVKQPVDRFPASHPMFSHLHCQLVSQLAATDSQHWCPLAEQGIAMVYKLSQQPDRFAEELLKDLAKQIFSSELEDSRLNSLLLSRLLFCVGHVAFLQMVHCEVVVAAELKHRRAIADTTNTSEKASTRKSLGGDDGLELTGASADDSDADLIRKVLETEVGGAGGLLASFEPFIVGVVSNPSKYSCPVLQTSACLALAKYMMISAAQCEKYVQLLFTVLEKSTLECVRANTVIAASDLACRFPNLLEPWTPYIYSRLADPAPIVRRNALTVLTHLILNDMVKVRGQISSMALCLEDTDSRISDLARLFFHELAQKGNTLYNVLPDIISHLTDPASDSSNKQTSFQNIVKFLFGFIHKDRLCESLVEKLCHRFRAARSNKQSHGLAYCLTLLPATERSLRKLQENISCYQDKLVDAQVYSAFGVIVNKLKKLSKPELKTIVEEFEQKLHQIHTKGLTDEEMNGNEQQRAESQHHEEVDLPKLGPSASPKPSPAEDREDFTGDVLTSARKQLVSAAPSTPLSLSVQKTISRIQSRSHRKHRQRLASESSESEIENLPPTTKLQLDCSSDSES